MNTEQAIKQNPVLTDDIKQQLLGAICTRGKYKGYLLASAPNVNQRPRDWLAWQVLVSNLAPVRVAAWSLMLGGQAEEFKKLDDLVVKAGLRFALNACEPAFRWNLWAQRYDQVKAAEELQRLYREYREKQAVKAKTA